MTTDRSSEFAPALATARLDREALGPLLEQYRSYLLLLARFQIGHRLRGKADAADLVQETFLEAHRAFDGFQGETEGVFLAWLRSILATRTARLVRRYGGTQARDVDLERTLERELESSSVALDRGVIARDDSPRGAAAKREQAVLLADALDRLPADYREAILLRQFEGLPFGEVAERLGRTVDAVQKLWVRGLSQLRELMGGPE